MKGNKAKRIIAAVLTLSLVFISVSSFAFAENNISNKTTEIAKLKRIAELDKKFNSKSVDKMPEGIVPLKFDTAEEADSYLSKLLANMKAKNSKTTSAEEISPMATGSDSKDDWTGGPLLCRTTVQYQYLYSSTLGCNYYNKIYAVSSSGVVLGPFCGWTPDPASSYGNIVNGGLSLVTHVAGYADIYFVVAGIGKITSVPQEYNNTFTNP